ncbi:MAG: glycosyl transferase family 36 [Firmicutes bacterium]|nr:glycosyl transferase family 36 [Bacillota bacterium]
MTALRGVRYILTLDADTQLPVGAAQRMIGGMDYGYNRARLNQEGTRVVAGYGVLQPRIGIKHEAVTRSWLGRLWAGEPGIDPYAFAVSDPYQDAFGEGIFTGKGIFDVHAFATTLCQRIPDNRVLSHDLLEGGFLRAGLLSDVELIDDHPATFAAFQMRLHRWVRGDWQLLMWLLPRVADRRGRLTPVDLSTLTRFQMLDNLRRSLLTPWLMLLVVFGLCGADGQPLRLSVIAFATLALPLLRHCASVSRLWRRPGQSLHVLGQVIVTAALLPFSSALMLDAIVRTLWRLGVSRKHLLEWAHSARVDRQFSGRRRPRLVFARLGYALLALTALAILTARTTGDPTAGLLFCVFWAFAPAYARLLDRPVLASEPRLSDRDRTYTRDIAKQIWAFYETYATAADHYLPPDNVQVEGDIGPAPRTSPTNIGLLLAATVAARDFDFIDASGMIDRLDRTVGTVERLALWNGHLYNWYDTRSLEPLPPLYVSTVDSGNLVTAMMTVRSTLQAMVEDQNTGDDDRQRAHGLVRRLDALMVATDFRPLYDEGARLFSLGFHVGIGEREAILYDLMASEARQASFVAIALGQVPVSHWFALGRATLSLGGVPTMMSWSGTMFEYFMPALFLRTYRDTLWDQSYRGALRRQIDYGHTCSLPWGISESGYFAFDYAMNYQYRAFGVPGLGYAPGLADDLVLSPYACLLAFRFAPSAVLTNLARLESLGARGDYGFYEALDFTPARMPRGTSHKVIRSFMAHHQGMSLLALANGLFDNVMVKRFHSDPRVAVTELLLQERPAFASGRARPHSSGRSELASRPLHPQAPAREFDVDTLAQREACLLSNGSWTTLVTPDGRGFCKQGPLLVTRMRSDSQAQSSGPVLYLRDVQTGQVWSPTYAPCEVATERLRVHFASDHARFTQTAGGLDCTLDICVAPEHDADLRRLTLTNTGTREQRVEVTSFQELALAPAQADLAHPAFAKLFIETSVDAEHGCLVARRRPRSPGESAVFAAHDLIVEGAQSTHRQFTTDRASFIGRGRDLRQPRGLSCSLGSEVGAVLDPAFVIRHTLVIPPGKEVKLFSILATAVTHEQVVEVVRRYDSDSEFARTLQLAWTRSQIELRHVHLTEAEAGLWQTLAGLALQGGVRIDERRQRAIAVTERGQTSLWSHGISGDVPMMAVTISDTADLAFVNRVARGHEYLRRLGLSIDLVLLCDGAGGYRQELYEAVTRSFLPDQLGGAGGAHILRTEQMPMQDVDLLIALAVACFSADGPSLKTQLRERVQPGQKPGAASTARLVLSSEGCQDQGSTTGAGVSETSRAAQSERSDFVPQPSPEGWELYNGWGGFANNGAEYKIALLDRRNLPAPWTNVLANPQFGCIITELGTGYTWWRNSRECKLTPWRNDPVIDDPGEMCFIRDIDAGTMWSPTPAPMREPQAYEVTHGRGWTRFLHESHGLRQETTVTVSLHDPVKVVRVTLTNQSSKTRHLAVTYMAQWTLGVQRDASSALIVSAWHEGQRTLIANHHYQTAFRDAHAFLHMNAWTPLAEPVALDVSFTSDEEEVYGALGSSDRPQGLEKSGLSGSTLPCAHPCAAISGAFALAAGAAVDVCVFLGCEASTQAALDLVQRLDHAAAVTALHQEVTTFWESTLSQIEVETPSPEFDLLLNGWLVYQALACRMWARTAFYQAGGAYGFRDQLQDAISLLHTRPDLTRAQILLHASHQFLEGDVQHWWHEETSRGIRTRYSDDLLWLPYAVARYVEHTGDREVLKQEITWLIDKPLPDGEDERYGETVPTKETGTLYEHCKRAISRGLRVGQHGIPLIGGGDWNDGLNLVGPQGRGESVWLGWFLCDLLQRFVAIARIEEDPTWGELCETNARELAQANESSAWDGQWYRRAYTDAGDWLGSISDRECKIDAIAQSFSVLSGRADRDRAYQAMHSFARELVDPELGIARLLKPPFDQMDPSPGYIQGYPPGIRENGGQYTHGVIWSVIAWCILKDGNRAFDLFHLLSPVSHTGTPRDVARYAGEPYVMAADVYGNGPHAGRAGWTWYTGAAGWMYQAGVEWLLGIRRRGDRLVLDPCLPDHWEKVRVRYRFGQSVFDITMQRAAKNTARDAAKDTTRNTDQELRLQLDGTAMDRGDDGLLGFLLVDDGNAHEVLLTTVAGRPEYAGATTT